MLKDLTIVITFTLIVLMFLIPFNIIRSKNKKSEQGPSDQITRKRVYINTIIGLIIFIAATLFATYPYNNIDTIGTRWPIYLRVITGLIATFSVIFYIFPYKRMPLSNSLNKIIKELPQEKDERWLFLAYVVLLSVFWELLYRYFMLFVLERVFSISFSTYVSMIIISSIFEGLAGFDKGLKESVGRFFWGVLKACTFLLTGSIMPTAIMSSFASILTGANNGSNM